MNIFILACTIVLHTWGSNLSFICCWLSLFLKARVVVRRVEKRAQRIKHKNKQARAGQLWGLPTWLTHCAHSNVWVECVCAHVEFSVTPLAHIYVLASAKLSFSANSFIQNLLTSNEQQVYLKLLALKVIQS